MTDRLQEIRARLDAATPGPWNFGRIAGDWGSVHTHGRTNVVINSEDDGGYAADQDLIAHAPADIAWLLDEVERLRGGDA